MSGPVTVEFLRIIMYSSSFIVIAQLQVIICQVTTSFCFHPWRIWLSHWPPNWQKLSQAGMGNIFLIYLIYTYLYMYTPGIYIYIHRYRYVCINIQYIWRDYWTIFSKYLEWQSPSLGDRKRSPPGSSSCHEGCIRRQRTVKKHGESNGLTNAFLWKIGYLQFPIPMDYHYFHY